MPSIITNLSEQWHVFAIALFSHFYIKLRGRFHLTFIIQLEGLVPRLLKKKLEGAARQQKANRLLIRRLPGREICSFRVDVGHNYNPMRITEAESRLSQTEDKATAALEKTVQSLSERAEDAENRSRLDNIRIIGLKEGAEGRQPVTFFQTWLPKRLEIETKHGVIKIDRAHRTLGLLKPILAVAKKDRLAYEGSDILITQDLSESERLDGHTMTSAVSSFKEVSVL
ncbi:unnamed protein product [Leuciscus chuanchicus]